MIRDAKLCRFCKTNPATDVHHILYPKDFNNDCLANVVSCCKKCHDIQNGKLVSKQEVLHAESNAILKAAKNGTPVKDATLYCTLSPCIDCSKLIIQAGIVRVVYNEVFKRDNGAIEFLSKFIKVEKIDDI
jgi:deoxycytidylate deaminase